MENRINIKNKKAYFDYELLEKFIAGMVLKGTEIKSVRMGKVSIVDAYCMIHEGEIFVKGLQIAEYVYGTHYNHEPFRERKLLLEKSDIRRIARKTKESGYTIIPLRIFISEKGYAKIEIALARGKKQYDKRESIKEKDTKRQLDRLQKSAR
jgi:SsrA-binding protein